MLRGIWQYIFFKKQIISCSNIQILYNKKSYFINLIIKFSSSKIFKFKYGKQKNNFHLTNSKTENAKQTAEATKQKAKALRKEPLADKRA